MTNIGMDIIEMRFQSNVMASTTRTRIKKTRNTPRTLTLLLSISRSHATTATSVATVGARSSATEEVGGTRLDLPSEEADVNYLAAFTFSR